MYTTEEYQKLKQKYGGYSSWAIWDDTDVFDTTIIDNSIDQLSVNHIFLGLNISRTLGKSPWSNFHDNTHSRKLRYACNNTALRGAYITDIFKDLPEADSSKLRNIITDTVISENVSFFIQEMEDFKIASSSTFIVLGKLTAKYFDRYYKKHFTNSVVHYDHYSAYAKYTDGAWVKGLHHKLGI